MRNGKEQGRIHASERSRLAALRVTLDSPFRLAGCLCGVFGKAFRFRALACVANMAIYARRAVPCLWMQFEIDRLPPGCLALLDDTGKEQKALADTIIHF